MNETDYVLLVQHGHLNIAAKLYDYIGGGKPILATVHPQGPERRLLEELRAGWWVDRRDVEGIRQLFIETAARGNSMLASFHPDLEKIAQYERKVLAKRYASLLYSIAGRERECGLQTPAAQPAGMGE
jgi:hypothetical protein